MTRHASKAHGGIASGWRRSGKMRHEVPSFGMISMPPLLLDWQRSLPSNDQINKLKERAAKTSEKLEYLEYSLLELEGKMSKRVTDCQNAERNEGEHLAKAFLLVNLHELEDLINESIQPEEGPSGTK
ncbi:uncharacterized protein LOC142166286 [Nicotiana tabacum]|uniref:Uncharacterized protein LOC142166286 n=1 Tax=Nicotiana tabacum TaxID=4097 RepID=A0AC58S871_TOBAC